MASLVESQCEGIRSRFVNLNFFYISSIGSSDTSSTVGGMAEYVSFR